MTFLYYLINIIIYFLFLNTPPQKVTIQNVQLQFMVCWCKSQSVNQIKHIDYTLMRIEVEQNVIYYTKKVQEVQKFRLRGCFRHLPQFRYWVYLKNKM